jgi:hypothetical protein
MSAERPSDAVRARILAAAKATPSKTHAEVARTRVVLSLAAAAPPIVMLAVFGAGAKGRPLSLAVTVAFVWSLLAVTSTVLTLVSSSPLGPRTPRLAALAVGGPIAAFVLGTLGVVLWPDTWTAATSPHKDVVCIGLGLVMGAAPLSVLLTHFRGQDPVTPRVRGASFGVVAGAWAGAGMMLVCPNNTATHVLVGHALPVLLFAFIGALVGQSVLALRRRDPR